MDPNDNETATINGGDLEAEEARLFAEGVDEKPEGDDGDDKGEGGGEGGDAAAGGEGSGAGEVDETAAAAAAAAAEAAAAAAAAAATPPAAAQLPEKPQPPKDFDAEIAAAEEAYNNGDLDAVGLNKAMRELTLEQSRYERQVENWEQQTQAIEASNKAAAENDWNATTIAFEATNKEFLSNPLRHKVMQDAINSVIATGEQLSNQQILDKALAIAVDYTGWKAPAAAPSKDEKDKVAAALKDRKPPGAPATLGDVPQAAGETFKGTAGFESLDALPTPELEVAFANMSPSEQERYLRDAPGATATGRD